MVLDLWLVEEEVCEVLVETQHRHYEEIDEMEQQIQLVACQLHMLAEVEEEVIYEEQQHELDELDEEVMVM